MNKIITSLAIVAFTISSAFATGQTIEHAMGTTVVPKNPTRVIVLTNEGTEALLALGVVPVGAAHSWNGDPWYPHLRERLATVTPVGKESAVNLEMIAALQPDLIIGNKQRHEKVYTQLSAIAPTVMSERLRGDWQVNFNLYAQALGRVDQGQQVLADYQSAAQQLSSALGASLQEQISIIRFLPGQIRIYQKDSFSGVLLSQLGFARPPIQDVDDFAIRTGKESIPDMDGDRIFHFTWDTGDGEGLSAAKEALNDPLWQSLTAVKAGRVYAVDDAIWNTSGGVISAHLMLENIAQIFNVKNN